MQPQADQYLWRYIKPERIDSFLKGEIYFSPLFDFDDYHESIEPLHYWTYTFVKRALRYNFDLSKALNELDNSESVMGNMLMWLALYDMEKKFTMLTGITDRKIISAKLFDCCENMSQFIPPHSEYKQLHYSSCWFVGDHVESALMWASYSQPGGIAVRIKFSDFKNAVVKYYDNLFSDPFIISGIEDIFAGLVIYKDYNDGENWLKDINAGVPRPFFKQHFYKQENEFRIVIKRLEGYSNTDFKRLHNIISEETHCDIILHPASLPSDLFNMKSKMANSRTRRLSLSEMDFNRPSNFSVKDDPF